MIAERWLAVRVLACKGTGCWYSCDGIMCVLRSLTSNVVSNDILVVSEVLLVPAVKLQQVPFYLTSKSIEAKEVLEAVGENPGRHAESVRLVRVGN